MCHFITAVLPGSSDHTLLASVAEKHGRNLKPQRNPSIEEQLNAGERYFLTTRGHCDCGTDLGVLRRQEKSLERRETQAKGQEEKLRREGWSEAKIARWSEQKAQHLAKPLTAPAATDWDELLKEMLKSGRTPFVALLLHWYDGPLEGRIQLKGREAVKADDLTPEILGRMKEDVLYEFQREA